MNELNDLTVAWAWVGAHLHRGRDERGAGAVEWLLIIIAGVAICGLVAAAVTSYVQTQGGKLNK